MSTEITFESIEAENPDSFGARGRHALQRRWEQAHMADYSKPRPVTSEEAARVSAASTGRRESHATYPRGIFELWREREREILRGA